MRDADGRIRGVDMLSTCPGGTKGIDPEIPCLDIDTFNIVPFSKDCDRAGRSVNASL
jgi:hypothetical protein